MNINKFTQIQQLKNLFYPIPHIHYDHLISTMEDKFLKKILPVLPGGSSDILRRLHRRNKIKLPYALDHTVQLHDHSWVFLPRIVEQITECTGKTFVHQFFKTGIFLHIQIEHRLFFA